MNYIDDPRMDYYKAVYKDSKEWDGKEPLADKRLIIYFCMGFGDCIQMLRYVPALQAKEIILHLPIELHSLVESQDWNVKLLDKTEPDIPEHDFHVRSLELPGMFPIIPKKPYLKATPRPGLTGARKIGVCWEGRTEACPLKHFNHLSDWGTFHSLQYEIINRELLRGCEKMKVYHQSEIKDFKDIAEIISSCQVVVSIDTAVLHLAGALGKKTFVVLDSASKESRWDVFEWYPSIIFMKRDGGWRHVFKKIRNQL